MIEIFDNFLEESEFNKIQNEFLGTTFPWFYNNDIVDIPNKTQEEKDLFQMCHTFYFNWSWCTNKQELVLPIMRKLNVLIPLRIKANLTFKTDKKYQSPYHVDMNVNGKIQKNKSAIFYVTNSNGPTVFKNGKKCECVENRLVLFDNNEYHAGTFSTDVKRRIVINFNFFTP
jgi:hypothetical protein